MIAPTNIAKKHDARYVSPVFDELLVKKIGIMNSINDMMYL